ncbi:MAG: thioesterase family protein [Cutibacterium granulosum]|nr:thioesterase family protein [Cutibacterium granulosum]
MSSTGPVRVEIPLRWSDMDAQGHVNNVRIWELVQEARNQAFIPTEAAPMLDSGMVVASQRVEFVQSFVVDEEPLLVDVWCSTVGAARIIMEYAAHHRGTKVARAFTELCPFDFVAGRLRRMYSQEKSAMLAMSAPATSWPALPVVDVAGRTDANDVVAVPIRWSDVDRYGHVNNVSLAGYLQEARILATTAWSPAMRRPGENLWVVARQDVRYVRQLHPSTQQCRVHTGLVRLGTSSITLAASVEAHGDTILNSAAVLVCVDRATGRATPIAEETRQVLAAHLVARP